MRKIMFRGKSHDLIWVYGYLIKHTPMGGKEETLITNGNHTWIVDPKSVGMCVGLPDKDGMEMYEGDIVSYEFLAPHTDEEIEKIIETKDVCGIQDRYETGIGAIIYGAIGFEIDNPQFYDYMGSLFSWNELRVIGNIFDNPELLRH